MMIPALYYDGRTSQAHVAQLSLQNTGLTVQLEDGRKIIWGAEEVKFVEPPTATTPFRLRQGFNGAERLVIADSSWQKILIGYYPLITQPDNLWSKNAKRLFGWGGAAVISLVFTVLVAVPLIARQVAENLPLAVEQQIGQQAFEHIVKTLAFIEQRTSENNLICGASGTKVDQHLAKLIHRLLPAQTATIKPLIKVVDLKMDNAFALPGGHIVLFRGLLEKLQDPNELAGIVAHELGHVAYRHSTKVFVEQLGTSVLIGLLFGDVTGGAAVAGLGQALLNSSHTREAEREADTYAIEVLNRENISALPAARFFQRLFEDQGRLEKRLSLLNTHPMSDDRADFFQANSTGTSPAMSDDAWIAIKNICARSPIDDFTQ